MISKSKSSIFEEFYIFVGVIKWLTSNSHSKYIILICIAKVDNCGVFLSGFYDCSLAREKENPRAYIQYCEQ